MPKVKEEPVPDGPLLTPQEAAKLLRVRVSWIYRMSAANKLAGRRLIGKYLRVDKAELLQWAAKQGNGTK